MPGGGCTVRGRCQRPCTPDDLPLTPSTTQCSLDGHGDRPAAAECMCVGAERDVRRRVTEPCADVSDRHTAGECERGMSVPQPMEAQPCETC
jgi:hypothetical protein